MASVGSCAAAAVGERCERAPPCVTACDEDDEDEDEEEEEEAEVDAAAHDAAV